MKCPKCGYLGFEQADKCRNCGYEFALAARRAEPELALRDDRETRAIDDLDLIDVAAATRSDSLPPAPDRRGPAVGTPGGVVMELPLFTDDAPLITKASPPRPPLAVRRATPEVPRLRAEVPRPPVLAFHEPETEMPPGAPAAPAVGGHHPQSAPSGETGARPAALGARLMAAAIDLALLATVDLAVLYFTLQICGLTPGDLDLLPIGPLVAFLLVQNGGYLVAFTAGGQTIGKMVTGIKVVAAEPGHSVDLGRAFQRTLMWIVLALPAGLGLLSALLRPDRRGFHDRFSGTKVIRAAAAA